MSWTKSAALIAVLMTAGFARANPQVSDSDPQVLVADEPGRPQPQTVTLYGSNLSLPSTNGFTFPSDVQLWATAPGRPWQQAVHGGWATITGWSADNLEVTLMGLEAPGTLQFQICVRTQGCMTAYYGVTIRARATYAPRLWDPNGETYLPISASVAPSDRRRLTNFYFDGLNDAATSCMYIDGTGGGYAPFARLVAGDGWGIFYMPSLSVGDHHIWISNSGCAAGHWSVATTIHVGISWP